MKKKKSTHYMTMAFFVAIALFVALKGDFESAPKIDFNYSCPPDCNVVLIVIDSLRADHLPCYGYDQNTAPNICKFAEENVLFEHAYSQSSWTKPSVSSIFTSSFPVEHKMFIAAETDKPGNIASSILDPSFLTLAEALSDQGYYTKSIVNNRVIQPFLGFDQGFDDYVDPEGVGYASHINKLFFDFLKSLLSSEKNRNFFVYLHYNDVHFPYTHPLDNAGECIIEYNGTNKLDALNPDEREYYKIQSFLKNGGYIEKNKTECLADFYDGGILFIDKIIGNLIQELAGKNLYNNTIVIITADHGEEFMEHGGLLHGNSLYNELIHVPLIMRFPGLQKNLTITQNVQLIDIMPTLLDYIGLNLTLFENLRGETLLPSISGGKRESSKIISEKEIPPGCTVQMRSVIDNHWKIISSNDTYEFYDLSEDPGEQINLYNGSLDSFSDLKGFLEEFETKFNNSLCNFHRVHIEKEILESLKALGYIN